MERNGDWIQTITGIKFYPFDPRPEEIELVDIAHALALTCRYNGHCREFYSVAQHSVLMATWDLPGSQRWRLFHDAAEAYICDIPKPIKRMLPGYKEAEEKILSIIGDTFSLGPMDHEAIRLSDLMMLAVEKRDILFDGPEWGLKLPNPIKSFICPWPWERAKEEFLKMASIMGIQHQYRVK